MLTIQVINDTYLKANPVQASELGNDQKVFIPASDKTLEISSYGYYPDGQHLQCLIVQPPMQFFAFLKHIKLFKDGDLVSRDLVSQSQLEAIAPNSDPARLAQLLPYLNSTMIRYQINTPLRKAHFLSQTAHESDGFNTNEEYASGNDYEGCEDLGNDVPGDGVRFKGRGLIQVTGRTNYAACGKALGIDLIDNPTRLGDFDLACLSAGWFWDMNGLNADADIDDIRVITRIINGGYNGLDDRQAYLDRAKSIFVS
ncbi:glycoside hydrolase family 19 protein [Pseudanabaena sp. 'Roaring Creek']|uniref:glycoside hydrolase family 19 protein n=1 Tax=Pseudanabaena sp. 'Roaring Creek' TaxID=1681830 RepID=UPI0006D7FF88|nr:glycoside hydrolase family 19 protein [Pseudanabaena sp. 'Roaring Creek']